MVFSILGTNSRCLMPFDLHRCGKNLGSPSIAVQQTDAWATVLSAASPGRTPVPTLKGPLGFVVGNLDQAYRVPPQSFPHRVIPRAGHAIHLESPEATALAIHELFKELQS